MPLVTTKNHISPAALSRLRAIQQEQKLLVSEGQAASDRRDRATYDACRRLWEEATEEAREIERMGCLPGEDAG